VLAGIEDAGGIDMRQCESFVGTSAGAIVAAHLVAGESPRRPASIDADVPEASAAPADGLAAAGAAAARRAGAWAGAIGASFAPLALGAAAPGGALLRAVMLQRIPEPRSTLNALRSHIERSRARFDGRLRVAAVDRSTGRRVMFGSPGAPRASVGEAVTASCTVPWLFEPVEIRGREYVDGGVWSPTNLDAAPASRDTQVLCLNPTASVTGSSSVLTLVRTVARSAASVEALVLRRRGAVVQLVAPSVESAAAMGTDFMDREPSERVLAAGYRQGLRLARAKAATP
jgi:NTE family protein